MRVAQPPKPILALLFAAALVLAAPVFAKRQGSGSATTAKTAPPKKTVPARVVRKRKPGQRIQTAPTPQRISEIQSALAAQGSYQGQANGKWDAATVQALRDFQAAHGLMATGKLDALTLQKLGLGSEVAGRAAPLPSSHVQEATDSTAPQTP